MQKFFLTSRFFVNFFKNFIKILLPIFVINISSVFAQNNFENFLQNRLNNLLQKNALTINDFTNTNNGINENQVYNIAKNSNNENLELSQKFAINNFENNSKNLQENISIQKQDIGQNENITNIALNGDTEIIGIKNPEKNFFKISEKILSGSIDIDSRKVQPYFFIMIPSGAVLKLSLPSEQIATDGFVKNFSKISLSLPVYESGEYVVELLDSRGHIFYKEKIISGNILKSEEKNNEKNFEKNFQKNHLAEINALRKKLGHSEIIFDETLSKIALRKANDMAEWQYIGHNSLGGKNILAFVEKAEKNFYRIGENVAGGRNTSFEKLAKWIVDSPAHRYNLVFPAWRKVGFASVEKDGNYYFVQIFSD